MRCAMCGAQCHVEKQTFHTGVLHTRKSPDNIHVITDREPEAFHLYAPLYFKATADGRGCAVPFCGVRCATTHFIQGSVK